MPPRHVPTINARYWVAITLTSVFGANLGDFVSHDLHEGHLQGVPYIFAAFALITIVARYSRAAWEGWFWLAIVALRTAATNLADLATHDGAFGTLPVCAGLVVVLVATLSIRGAIAPDPVGTGVQRIDAGYWLAMLTAGTLGTALGDGLADALSLPGAALLAAVAIGVAFGLRASRLLGAITGYWLVVVAIRTFGTNVGDMLAHRLSLPISTPLTGAALLILLLVWRERQQTVAQTA